MYDQYEFEPTSEDITLGDFLQVLLAIGLLIVTVGLAVFSMPVISYYFHIWSKYWSIS